MPWNAFRFAVIGYRVPHHHYFAPPITGSVFSGGVPLANAEIVLTGRFTNHIATTRSDGQGHFKIGPLTVVEFVQWLMGDPLFGYSLNFTVDNQTYLGPSESSVGYVPTKIEVNCDLSHPISTGWRAPVFCSHRN
jgi:hypothetical protein